MAESRLDFRRRQGHEHGPHSPPAGELGFSSRGLGPAAAAQSFGAAMAPDSMSFGESEQNGPGIDRISGNSMSVNSSHGGHGHSFSFGGGGAGEELAGEPMSVFLLRGRPGSAGGSNVLPGLRDSRASVRELEGNQVGWSVEQSGAGSAAVTSPEYLWFFVLRRRPADPTDTPRFCDDSQ